MRLVFALLLLSAYHVESAPAYQASPNGEDAGKSQAPVSIRAPSSPTETPVSANYQQPASDKIKRSEWFQIFISGIVALVVLWQAWMHNDQRKATRIAERGYIGVKSTDLLYFEPGEIPAVEVVFLNGGRTPLWNVYTPGTLFLNDKPPDDTETHPSPTEEPGAFMVAGATGTVRWFLPVALNAPTISEIIAGRLSLYLKGEAWFEDCWGERRNYPFYLVYNARRGIFEQRKRYAEYMDYQMAKDAPIKRKRNPS